ncbi:MAG TPA: KTSC domain-containing protein [Chthoniobacterales bacterium]|jgi:hypothetical protein|nr:KTSC domain-containing protein [Chthoniobacterales bacterium]
MRRFPPIALLACLFFLGLDLPAAPAPSGTGIVSRIKRVPVESSALAAVGYSKRLRALEIEFRNGAIYRYLEVPGSVHRAFMDAPSKARFYHQNVRRKFRSLHVKPRSR